MKRRVLLSFIISIVVFVLTGTLVIKYTHSILIEDRKILSIAEVFTALDKFRLSFRSTVTSHGFYLLTSDDQYLKEYQTHKSEVSENIRSIDSTGYGYLLLESKIDTIEILLSQELRLLDSVIVLKKKGNQKEATRLLEKEAYPIYNKIKGLAENQSDNLESMQRMIKNHAETEVRYIISILITGFAFGLLFIIYSFFKLLKENRGRKQSEDELRSYTEELKRTNWTKDMFFSIIAHDLRSPFNSLLNLFDLLSEAISKNDISMIEQNISAIEFSARRTFNLLQNLLEWSKLQTGRLKIVPEFFNINEVIEENIALYKEAAIQKSIGLSSGLKDTMVYADRNITSTVIRNLVGNAIKFTEKGAIEINGVKKENQLNVIIRDTGIGLSEEDISRLFRIELSTSDIGNSMEKGSGLGLILSKSFVELNKGKIWVESIPGKGSSFFFTLPMQRNFSGK